MLLDGRDVSGDIRTAAARARPRPAWPPIPRCGRCWSPSSSALLADGDWVAEGRDIALVVAPDAEVKVFLTATAEERARRRAADLGADVQTVLRDQTLRDERDQASGDRTVTEPAPGALPSSTRPG